MTLATPPISAAAEQQQEYDDNQEPFHGKPPLMVWRYYRLAGSPFIWSNNEHRASFDASDDTKRAQDQIVPMIPTVESLSALGRNQSNPKDRKGRARIRTELAQE
jgi:hypothetical protein